MVLDNYRPISNLSFISKILEKKSSSTIAEFFLDENKIFEVFQSGLKKIPFYRNCTLEGLK